MKTMSDNLEEYKKAIKAKFEQEKKGVYSSYLISPSRAKLRQLCEEKLKNSNNPDDLISFKFLFGFDFDVSNKNKLQANTDKFRPIETFLKGETDLMDLEAINITAMLVDFNPRPFRIFNTKSFGIQPLNKELKVEEFKKNDEERNLPLFEVKTTESRKNLKKKITIGVLGLIGLTSIGYTAKNIIAPTPQCMQWQKNHYECVDCDKKELLQISPIIPIDESLINLKKIEVNKRTQFFSNGKPIIWYYKKNDDKLEFYNSHGIHPETGKQLKAITNYMIKKYVK